MKSFAVESAPRVAAAPKTFADDIVHLALAGLEQMYDPERRLFCFTFTQTEAGKQRQGISHRYSIMTVLGLHRAEQSGLRSAVDVQTAAAALLEDLGWVTNLGDLGLCIWLAAVVCGERVADVCSRLDADRALLRWREARQVVTMDVAWYLAGLCHAALAGHNASLTTAKAAFDLLKTNQGKLGIFGHQSRTASIAGRVRGRIGSFADQVYPIYAFAKFAQAFGSREALERATKCAETICRHQGSSGQWWWHYDAASGKVAGQYPVFSVHQDGMGPMALRALAEAGGPELFDNLRNGLRWIDRNEVGSSLRDESRQIIWRCAYQPKHRAWSERITRLIGSSLDLSPAKAGLRIAYECRPYELGWALYGLC